MDVTVDTLRSSRSSVECAPDHLGYVGFGPSRCDIVRTSDDGPPEGSCIDWSFIMDDYDTEEPELYCSAPSAHALASILSFQAYTSDTSRNRHASRRYINLCAAHQHSPRTQGNCPTSISVCRLAYVLGKEKHGVRGHEFPASGLHTRQWLDLMKGIPSSDDTNACMQEASTCHDLRRCLDTGSPLLEPNPVSYSDAYHVMGEERPGIHVCHIDGAETMRAHIWAGGPIVLQMLVSEKFARMIGSSTGKSHLYYHDADAVLTDTYVGVCTGFANIVSDKLKPVSGGDAIGVWIVRQQNVEGDEDTKGHHYVYIAQEGEYMVEGKRRHVNTGVGLESQVDLRSKDPDIMYTLLGRNSNVENTTVLGPLFVKSDHYFDGTGIKILRPDAIKECGQITGVQEVSFAESGNSPPAPTKPPTKSPTISPTKQPPPTKPPPTTPSTKPPTPPSTTACGKPDPPRRNWIIIVLVVFALLVVIIFLLVVCARRMSEQLKDSEVARPK